LYDFGDCVRSSAATSAEDQQDLSKVTLNLAVFEALVNGYLDAAGSMLRPVERELLPFSARLITFENGIRFLTDYLEGDVYFKTHMPEHNLIRARTQFQLVRAMEQNDEAMHDIVNRAGR
jgi:hypothetical protein